MARPTYATIDLDAVIHNIGEVKRHTGGGKICAAVKADAYGHGAGAVAHAMSAAGVDMFAVAMTEEAVQLRQAGVAKPVILLAAVPEEDIETLMEFDIRACIVDAGFAEKLSAAALRNGAIVPVHINIDTGMGRMGFACESAAGDIMRVWRLPGLRIEGIFTHLACSENHAASSCQLALFRDIIARLESAGMPIPLLHAANSAATLQMPESHLRCVRPGLILYGLYPPNVDHGGVSLKPVMSLHTRVVFSKRVPAGTKLGYGHTFITERESMIATLPLGYHDGYLRQYSNSGQVLIGGRRAPVVGRVCMDQTLVDVTDVPGAGVGDEVVVYGSQLGGRISVEEMAGRLERIPYELTCAVGARVRRRYMLDGAAAGETCAGALTPVEVTAKIFSDSPVRVKLWKKNARGRTA